MSNSVDELRARHDHCHVNGLLELVMQGHRDVTVEGHEEARHLEHCPQGHELVPERLQVHKAMTMYLGGSKSRRALEELPRRQRKRQDAVAIFTTNFAPAEALVLIVPSLLPQSAVVLKVLIVHVTVPSLSPPESMSSTMRAPSDSDWRRPSDFF